jgi:hypothetical protein
MLKLNENEHTDLGKLVTNVERLAIEICDIRDVLSVMKKINIYDESNIYLSELRQISNKNKTSITNIKHVIYKLYYRYSEVRCCSNVTLNSFNFPFREHSQTEKLPQNFPQTVSSPIQTIHINDVTENIPDYITIEGGSNFNHHIPIKSTVDSIKNSQTNNKILPFYPHLRFSQDKIKTITNFINMFIDNYDYFNDCTNWRDKTLTHDALSDENINLECGNYDNYPHYYDWWCWKSSDFSKVTICGHPVEFLYKYRSQNGHLSYYFKFIHKNDQMMTSIKNIRLLRKKWCKNLNLRFSILPKDIINIVSLHLLNFVLTELNTIINELYVTKYTDILKKR